jgi:hypothetical protein
MFKNLIDRFSSNLGLSPDEAIKSELVKKLCTDLINGQVVVIDSAQSKYLSLPLNLEQIQEKPTELNNHTFR